MDERQHGRVLLITGPSSAGKTAIAQELQRRLAGLWLIAGVDMFWACSPSGNFRRVSSGPILM